MKKQVVIIGCLSAALMACGQEVSRDKDESGSSGRSVSKEKQSVEAAAKKKREKQPT